jgi:predicted nucleotidyltransferase
VQAAFPGAEPSGARFDIQRKYTGNLNMKPIKTSAYPTEKLTTEDPDLADRFNRVLSQTIEAMDESGIRYLFIGGIASRGLGRPRSTHDIDIFVMPEEAEFALRALAKNGFNVEKTDPTWLYKGFKENILVDVIFKSKGDIYLDSEMYQRMITTDFQGKRLRLVAPEDLLIIKAAAHSELTPNHWHDAIALLSYANIDWPYLVKRARRAPRRILSLLLYAQSNDIWVPNQVIHELFVNIFEGFSSSAKSQPTLTSAKGKEDRLSYVSERVTSSAQPYMPPQDRSGERSVRPLHGSYAVAHLRERLAEDPRTNELDIQIEQQADKLLLRGEVQMDERKRAVEQIAHEIFPQSSIENQIRVTQYTEPMESEEFK